MCLGMATGVRKPEKDSLLKPYTNFEKIKAMSIDEMAENYPCPYKIDYDVQEFCPNIDCVDCTRKWLESEVEK